MSKPFLPIVIYLEKEEDRSLCRVQLTFAGFRREVDYGLYQYKETVEEEVYRSHAFPQLLIIGTISGSESATEYFVRGLKRFSPQLKVAWFDTHGYPRRPYDQFIRKVAGPNFCDNLTPQMKNFLKMRSFALVNR